MPSTFHLQKSERSTISLFSAAIPGPESLPGGRPLLVVSFVFIQIVVTLILVGVLSQMPAKESGHPR